MNVRIAVRCKPRFAIRTHGAIDFPNGVPARMTQRMLVPYPSVPEEVETATNIAKQRAQAIRRVVFGVATEHALRGRVGTGCWSEPARTSR